MKFMKLGSKPDTFLAGENNTRYVASELATDVVIHVGDVKFHLHKFPLLSKSARMQKLVLSNPDEITIHDIPGGPSAFEICAKFCYGMSVTLNAHNVVPTRCAAEYLEMHESVDKGNLVYKVDAFLNSSIFRSWKDTIMVLQTTKPLLPLSEELKLISHCIDTIASKTSVDVSKVDWSYTYDRKKKSEEIGSDVGYNGEVRTRIVPPDWWVEDVSELDIDLYKRLITAIKDKGVVSNEVVGEALKVYAYRKLPGSGKNVVPQNDVSKFRAILDAVVLLLPAEKGCVSCSFLFKLLKAAISADSDEGVKMELVKKIGQQLEEATVNDLLIRTCDGEMEMMYDVDVVRKVVEEFVRQDRTVEIEFENEIHEVRKPGILSEASKLMVGKLVDGYLGEIGKDPNLPLSLFLGIAEMVSGFLRPCHDGLYRAIDTFLKEHPGISKSERKRVCGLFDCKKLSADACMHAVQNERLPLRVVVQVLFFEQVRAAASSGSSTPDLPKSIKEDLNGCNSHGSSRTGNEDWDGMASAEELRALRGELAAFKLGGDNNKSKAGNSDRAVISKVKGLIMSRRIFSKMWSRQGENAHSGSDSSGSHDEGKSTPSVRVRHSVS